jgi:DNA polymerase-4
MHGNGEPAILHADLDAFYASVALLRDPGLVGLPVAVGGGVVLSCTYEARRFGVRGGMPLGRARELCPDLVVVGGEFGEYLELSDVVFGVLRGFTPLVEPVSIDEAFLDVTGSIHLFGPPRDIAVAIRAGVRKATGLPISVGGAHTKFLAKVASRVAKPDGLLIVASGSEVEFLHQLTVDHLWGVGPVTLDQLAQFGVSTIGELAETPVRVLATRIGTGRAAHLHALAWNRDPRGVAPGRRAKSVGAQSAFGRDERSLEVLRPVLAGLAARIGSRLRKKLRAGRTLTLRVRFSDLAAVTRARTMGTATASSAVLFHTAGALLEGVLDEFPERGIGLLGISMTKLQAASPLQLELPLFADDLIGGSPRELELQALDAAVDGANQRFGRHSVEAGSSLLGPKRDFAEGLSDIMTTDR